MKSPPKESGSVSFTILEQEDLYMTCTFRRARTCGERTSAYRLRYETFIQEKGWWTASEKDVERDAWDGSADLYVALNAERQVIGTVRTLSDSPLGFQFDELGIRLPATVKRHNFVEISRVAVAQGQRGQPVILLGLCRALAENKAQEGHTHWGGIIVVSLVRLLERTGIRFSVKSEPFMDYGAERMFVLASGAETSQCLCQPRINSLLAGHRINPAEEGEILTTSAALADRRGAQLMFANPQYIR